jgi:hypothetical protein
MHGSVPKYAVLGSSIRKSRVCVSTESSTPVTATEEEQQQLRDGDVAHTDALIIGGGPSGLAAAIMLAKRGWNVTVAGAVQPQCPCKGTSLVGNRLTILHATAHAQASAAYAAMIVVRMLCFSRANVVDAAHDHIHSNPHFKVLQPAAVRLLAHTAVALVLSKTLQLLFRACSGTSHTPSIGLHMKLVGLLPQQCYNLLHLLLLLLLLLLLQSGTHKSAMRTPTAGAPDKVASVALSSSTVATA